MALLLGRYDETLIGFLIFFGPKQGGLLTCKKKMRPIRRPPGGIQNAAKQVYDWRQTTGSGIG